MTYKYVQCCQLKYKMFKTQNFNYLEFFLSTHTQSIYFIYMFFKCCRVFHGIDRIVYLAILLMSFDYFHISANTNSTASACLLLQVQVFLQGRY